MDQGVVGVMGDVSEGLKVLNMPLCLRNGARLESCKPCQGGSPLRALGPVEAHGAF
jgi:hypothetical protein